MTDDFGFILEFLLIRNTSGAMVSQLQQPIHLLSSTCTNRLGCTLGSLAFSNSPFLPSAVTLALYSSQNFLSYSFQKSGSPSSNSLVYLPQSSSGMSPGFCPGGTPQSGVRLEFWVLLFVGMLSIFFPSW